MTPLVAYYRVSTERQGRSGLGLDAQRETVRRHAQASGGRIVAEFEEHLSGRLRCRPQLAAAMHTARHHGATVVVAKLDRIARDVSFLLELVDSGVPIYFCDLPNLRTDDPIIGRLILTVMGGMAEFEARRIGQRIKEAMAAKKARTGTTGTGMDNKRTRKAVERANKGRPAKAAAERERLLKLTAPMRARKRSAADMARVLNEKGERTAGGRPWTGPNLWRVLKG
jgi:DNA invertase Pin-like site-specific DNA recombinase